MAEIRPAVSRNPSSPFQELDRCLFIGRSSCNLRRGPMYAAYAQLRERKLRNQAGGCDSAFAATPTKKKTAAAAAAAASPLSQSVPDFSMVVAKENKKPTALQFVPRIGPWMTPPASLAPKAEQKKAGSASANKADDKRFGGAGGGRAIPVRKSYACLKELKEYSAMASLAIHEVGNAARAGGRGTGKKAAAGARRLSTTWLG